MLRKTLAVASLAIGGLWAPAGFAQDIVIPNIIELSGGGAAVGAMWKNGSSMAVEEINNSGGILGKKIKLEFIDTASDPGKARAAMQRALDDKPIAIFGPIYSGSVSATLKLTNDAEVPQVMGGEAGPLTAQGSKYIFRTSFGQNVSMPKIANYLRDEVKAKAVAVIYINNDFGKGGRDVITKEFAKYNIKVAADISTEAGQADFAADVSKIKAAAPDVVFVYVNEEESARMLKELKRQSITVPLMGETTLVGQKVVELAGDAANGARGHVGLTTDAPVDLVKAFREKFVKKYNYVPDHNGLKGYLAIYMIKATTEKMGKVDSKAFADNLHGLTIKAASEPGILMDVTFDEKGDIDRQGFLVEIVEGKQVVKQVLPKLN